MPYEKVLLWDTDLYFSFSDVKVETVITVTKHLDTTNSWIAFHMLQLNGIVFLLLLRIINSFVVI